MLDSRRSRWHANPLRPFPLPRTAPFPLPRPRAHAQARAASTLGRSGLKQRQIAPSRRLFLQGGCHTDAARGEADAQLKMAPGRLGVALETT